MSAATLQRRLRNLRRLPQTTMRDAGKAVETIAKRVGAEVGPVHLGRKKRAVQLRAITRVKGTAGGKRGEGTVYGVPTGPWVWVTAGTTPHTIAPRSRGRGKARTTRYMKGDGYAHPYGAPVQHPGGTGKGAWRRVQKQAPPAVVDTYRKAIRKAIGR